MKHGLGTYLLADTDISAAISGLYSFPAPQDASAIAKPYLMISRVDETIENLIGSSLDVYDEPWQIDVIAKKDIDAENVKELVITRLNGASRVVMGDYFVYSCGLNFVRDGSELEDNAGEKSLHRKIMEFQIKRNREVQ